MNVIFFIYFPVFLGYYYIFTLSYRPELSFRFLGILLISTIDDMLISAYEFEDNLSKTVLEEFQNRYSGQPASPYITTSSNIHREHVVLHEEDVDVLLDSQRERVETYSLEGEVEEASVVGEVEIIRECP